MADIIEKISSPLAFFPPTPSTYRVDTATTKDGARRCTMVGPSVRDEKLLRHCTCRVLKTKRRRGGGGGEDIVSLFVPYPGAKKTILYSHGNAVDLGIMHHFHLHMSRVLQVNVMGYDYSGYGASSGRPTVRNTLADIRAVWECLLDECGIDPRDVILYGQSVGSGPTAELASKLDSHLGGVVLHSPLVSGMRVLAPQLRRWPSWLDIYPNHRFVPAIQTKVLVLHGTEDEVIDVAHGKLLHSLCKHPGQPLWAEGFDHQNLESHPHFTETLATFLNDVDADR